MACSGRRCVPLFPERACQKKSWSGNEWDAECRNDYSAHKEYYFGFLNRLKTTKPAALIPIVNLISAAVYFIVFFILFIVPPGICILPRYFREKSRT